MKKTLLFFPIIFIFILVVSSCSSKKEEAPAFSWNPALTVAVVDGTNILRAEVEEQMGTVNRMYQAMESSLSQETIEEKKQEARLQILNNLVENQIILNKTGDIENNLSDEHKARIEAAYEGSVDRIADYVRKTYPDLGPEAMLREVETLLKTSRLSLEDIRKNSKNTVLRELLYESVLAEAGEPAPAEIEMYYRRLLAEQKENFGKDVSRYEQALLSGSPVVFHPAECRVIREININFDADVIGLIRQLESFDSHEEAEKMRKDQFLRQEEKVKRVLEKLKTMPFDGLIAEELGPGIIPPVNYISSQSSRFSPEYRDAALAIPRVGETSPPIRAEYGTLILLWEETGPRGEVPLWEIYDTIQEAARREQHGRAWEEIRAIWREAAEITLYPENLK
jgi:hypothetical protein